MIITVNTNNSERQSAIVTINTQTCHYPYAIRDAFELALQLEGHSQEAINEIFNQYQDTIPDEQEKNLTANQY